MHEGGSRGRLAEARPTKGMKGLGFRVDRGSNYPIIRYLGFGVLVTFVHVLGTWTLREEFGHRGFALPVSRLYLGCEFKVQGA